MIKKFLLLLIKGYKKGISPLLGNHCRFSPTCSMYMYEAIQKHGILKGIILGIRRLFRCHPFYPGGYDPVPDSFSLNPLKPKREKKMKNEKIKVK